MRLEQLERVVATYGALRSRRLAVRACEVGRVVSESMGTPYCRRTTLRDLQALERIGIAERSADGWRCVGPLSFFEAASVMLARPS